MSKPSPKRLIILGGGDAAVTAAQNFAAANGYVPVCFGHGQAPEVSGQAASNDILFGVLGRYLVSASVGKCPAPLCIGCFLATAELKMDLREREAEALQPSSSAALATQASPFMGDMTRSLLSWAADARDTSGTWMVAADLQTLQVETSAWPFEATCDRCNSDGAETSVASESTTKPSSGSYRTRRLSDFDLAPGRYVNNFNGPLGDAVFHNRASPFNALAQATFNGPKGTKAELNWFGSATTYASSTCAGLLEGFERRAGARPPAPGETRIDSLSSLGEDAVDPRSLGLYDEIIYDQEPRLTRFDEQLPLSWTRCLEFGGNRQRYVSSDFVFYGNPQLVFGNSSGCASGSSIPEALLHALMELVERDAFLLHWYARLTPRRIRNSSLKDLESETLIARLRSAGTELLLFDLRTDLPFPVVMAIALGDRNGFGCFSVATGASLDPVAAARKAIQEVAILNHGFGLRSQKAAEGRLRNAPQDFSLIRSLDDHALLYGNPVMRPVVEFLLGSTDEAAFDECFAGWLQARPQSLDLNDDVTFVHNVLSACGYPSMLHFDQTMPQGAKLGVRTVRAIVPGLLPIDFGHGKCRAANLPRLYNAPFRFGRSQRPLVRSDLNTAPHPFA